MQKLMLVRDLPGSGKTTYAKSYEGFYHVEADMFFVGTDGVYRFSPSKLGEAHTWCQRQAALALERGDSVVVSNTFTRKWEMEAYLDMAVKLSVPVDVVSLQPAKLFPNIHGVPDEAISKMRSRWELFPGEKVVVAWLQTA